MTLESSSATISPTPAKLSDRQLENASLLMGAFGALVDVVVGLVQLRDLTPFRGSAWSSVGAIASMSAGVFAAVVCLVTLLRFGERIVPWYGKVSPVRRLIGGGGLTLMLGTLMYFAMRSFNSVVDAAFIGLQFDVWSGTAYIAGASAISGYVVSGIVGRLSTALLSVLVSVFLVMGAVLSAVNTSNEFWWRVHFSQLGMTPGLAGFAFNYTLALTGLVMMTMADFLTHDMQRWLDATDQGRWKSHVVRSGIVTMGAMLSGIGLIPVTLSHRGHLIATYGAVLSFMLLAVLSPIILRQIPWAFRWVSAATLALLALLTYLFKVAGTLGTTGFEMLAVSLALVWMMLFIRTVVAAARDLPVTDPAPQQGDLRGDLEASNHQLTLESEKGIAGSPIEHRV